MKIKILLTPVEGIGFALSAILFFGPVIRGNEIEGREGPRCDTIADWTTRSFDVARLSQGRIQWPSAKEIESFFPLGFSSDGWFAYADRLKDLCLEEPLGKCNGDAPCFDVSLFNVTCEQRCSGDIDPTAGAICRCFRGISICDMKNFGIRPQERMRLGKFPVRFDGVDYDIEITFREKALYSEVLREQRQPEFPESRVFLTAGTKERKLLAEIDHNNSGIGIGVRVAGWLKDPELDQLVVLLLARRIPIAVGDSALYYLLPIAADLGTEAKKMSGVE